MSTQNNDFEGRLRQMFHQSATNIDSTYTGVDLREGSGRRPTRHRVLSVAAAVALLVAAITAVVEVGLRSGSPPPPPTSGIVMVTSDGAVKVVDPSTGAVARQLVAPSPVDTQGAKLSDPDAVATGGEDVFVGYDAGRTKPDPVIASVPLSGGAVTLVASGFDPAVSADGSRLAFVRISSSGESIVVKDLPDGSEHVVWSSSFSASGFAVINELAWSHDGALAVAQTTVLMPDRTNLTQRVLPGIVSDVFLLDLASPLSSSNPRPIGPSQTSGSSVSWTDPQFIAPSTVAVLASGATRCTQGAAVLLVDTSNETSTTGVALPPGTVHVLYGEDGQVIAYVKNPDLCSRATSSSEPSTTTTTHPVRIGSSVSAGSSTATFRLGAAVQELYADHDGVQHKLADHVAAAAFLP